jgi:hypothetical protein
MGDLTLSSLSSDPEFSEFLTLSSTEFYDPEFLYVCRLDEVVFYGNVSVVCSHDFCPVN